MKLKATPRSGPECSLVLGAGARGAGGLRAAPPAAAAAAARMFCSLAGWAGGRAAGSGYPRCGRSKTSPGPAPGLGRPGRPGRRGVRPRGLVALGSLRLARVLAGRLRLGPAWLGPGPPPLPVPHLGWRSPPALSGSVGAPSAR